MKRNTSVKNSASGLFIVFEGIDGSGKDTQIRLLADRLEKIGYQVLVTSEPWISAEGDRLRDIARSGRNGLSPEKEAELYFLDRRAHVAQEILPALRKGQIVICGRYYYSTMAYQGALGANLEEIRKTSEAAFPIPDIVILLDINPEEALKRIQTNRSEGIAPGYEKAEYLKSVREVFLDMRDPYIKKIDGAKPEKEIADEVFHLVLDLFKSKKNKIK